MSSAQKTTLAAAITTVGQSSITVSAHVGFPATAAFTVLIDAELLRVTAGYGTTSWTVTRGYLATTAATHSNGATVTYVPDALADLDDLIASMALGGDTSRYGLLVDMLADVSADIHAACMRTFWVPTADVTFYVDVVRGGRDSLVDAADGSWAADGRALDLVSVTNLYVRDSETSSYVEISAGDTGYYLQGGPPGTGVAGTDWPYEDVLLSPAGSYAEFPVGRRAVRIIGKPGFPAIPRSVTRATISEVRERFRQSIGGGPVQAGVNQFGTPIFLTGDSPDMRRVLRTPFSRRPMAA